MKPSPRFLDYTFASLAILACSAVVASGQTTWTGAGDGTTWTLTNNWTAGLPTAAAQTRFLNGSLPDASIVIDVDSPQTVGALNFANSSLRTVTFNGSALTVDGTHTWNTSTPGSAAITFNTDVVLASSANTNTTWSIGISQPVTFNGNITRSGTENRQMTVSGNSNQVITINGSNAATSLSFGGSGEVIAGSTSALGTGGVQKTSASILSLRSDVTVNTTWAQTTGTPYTYLRLSEIVPGGTTDRTFTINDRIAGSTGAFEWIPNVNSTGKLILELKYNGGTAQSLPLITTESAIVRFAQAPSAARTYSGLISGAGSVELTAGGSTLLTATNTYTGTTTVSSGNLLVGGAGTIQGTSELRVGTGATFNVAGITAESYTFGSAQRISGTGSIVAGGKNISLQGSLDPGNSPGTLTFNMGGGVLSLGSDVDLIFELGTLSDLVLLSSGTLDIGSGTLGFGNFSFTAASGFGAGTYSLFETPNAILGTLANATGTIGGLDGTLLISGNNLVLEVVPEPSTVALLALGGLYLLGRRLGQRSVPPEPGR